MLFEKLEGALPRLVVVFSFGAIGALLRSFILGYQHVEIWNFPYLTLLINVVGCFLIGISAAFFATASVTTDSKDRRISFRQSLTFRFGIMTGFLGGLTTFSTLSKEVFNLVSEDEMVVALTYVLTSVALGIVAVFLGKWVVYIFREARRKNERMV